MTNTPPNFIDSLCQSCSNIKWENKTSKTIGNNDMLLRLLVSSIQSLYKDLGNEAIKHDFERTQQFPNVTIYKEMVSKQERYSLTFSVTPPLQVPFAVVLPTGSMIQQPTGVFSWLCSGGSAAPAKGHCDKTIICISRDSVAVLPVSNTIAQGETGLAPAALNVLQEQATKACLAPAALKVLKEQATKANEANEANKLPAADQNAQAGANVRDPKVGGGKHTSLPPIVNPRPIVQVPIAQVGAAGGGKNGRAPAQGGGGGGEAKPGPGAGMNGSNPFTTDPASHYRPSSPPSPTNVSDTGQEPRKFAAFFLDPLKHANLLGYLALQTLFERNTVDTQETQDNITGFEPINSVSSRIIDALPTVTYFEALESDIINDIKLPIFRYPTQIDNRVGSVDILFDTPPWQEQYFLQHLENRTEYDRHIYLDSSTIPQLAITRVASMVPSPIATKLNMVVLTFASTHDNQVSRNHRKEMFYLFWDDFHDDSHPEKYLVAYSGRMQETIDAISNDPSHNTASERYRQYMDYINMYMQHQALSQPPGAPLPLGMTLGVHYWKCPETTDMGFWHDHAHDILCDVDSAVAFHSDHTKARKLDNFILVIAKRLFRVALPTNPQLTYKFESNHHKVVVGDEFHVIIRLEQDKALIFYTGKNAPKNCSLSSHAEALNTVPGRGNYV